MNSARPQGKIHTLTFCICAVGTGRSAFITLYNGQLRIQYQPDGLLETNSFCQLQHLDIFSHFYMSPLAVLTSQLRLFVCSALSHFDVRV